MKESVFLGLGSNDEPELHLRAGLAALSSAFGPPVCSPVYRSAAVGFDGRDFLNLACRIETALTPVELKAWLTDLEDKHGRRRDLPKFADRTLDIDILLYGSLTGRFGDMELPRDDILKYAHVLKPLADLAPELRHPVTNLTFASHWAAFRGENTLELVPSLRLGETCGVRPNR